MSQSVLTLPADYWTGPIQVKTAHYFVHVWFDSDEQPEIETQLKQRIDLIAQANRTSEAAAHILVFCDLPVYSEEEAELATIWKLAEAIAEFLSVQQVHSIFARSPELLVNSGRILGDRYPKELIDDLYRLFDGKWQLMRAHSPLIEQFEKWIDLISITETEDRAIRAKCQAADAAYIEAVDREFLRVLNLLSDKYAKKNPFWFRIRSDSQAHETPENPLRRERIFEHARKSLSEDRIFGYEFPNGMTQDTSDERDRRFRETNRADRETQLFGNATEYIERIIGELDRKSFLRYRDELIASMVRSGLRYDIGTNHFIGGEYWKQCINTMKYHLVRHFGFSHRKVFTDPSISLGIEKLDDFTAHLRAINDASVDSGLIGTSR